MGEEGGWVSLQLKQMENKITHAVKGRLKVNFKASSETRMPYSRSFILADFVTSQNFGTLKSHTFEHMTDIDLFFCWKF